MKLGKLSSFSSQVKMIGQATNKIWAALASNLVCKLEYASWFGLAITTYSLDPNKIAINQPNGYV